MTQNEFNEIVKRMNTAEDSNNNGSVADALIISDGTNVFKHVFTVHGRKLHEVRSIGKLVVSLCIGILIDSGLYSVDDEQLSLNTQIWSILSEKVHLLNTTNIVFLKKLTIKNLLTQTTGYSNDELLFSATLKNHNYDELLDIVFNEPINNEPGELFVYSNASAFILSAFIQELTGESLYEYAKKVLFVPLDIIKHSWINYGKYCAGATGLYLMSEDVYKLGKLMLDKGAWNHKQIVSEVFINEMIKAQVEILDDKWRKHPLSPTGYGFFMWISNSDRYYISGAKGQYLIIKPSKEIIVSVLSNQENTIPLLNSLKDIL